MSFQWLEMRITEENERRQRESAILARLPAALEEVHDALALCIESYRTAFGRESAELRLQPGMIELSVREQRDGQWRQVGRVEVVSAIAIPGFQVDRGTGGDALIVEVGILPGDKLFYRDRAKDQYVTMEELTKRVLDRALFPNLNE